MVLYHFWRVKADPKLVSLVPTGIPFHFRNLQEVAAVASLLSVLSAQGMMSRATLLLAGLQLL